MWALIFDLIPIIIALFFLLSGAWRIAGKKKGQSYRFFPPDHYLNRTTGTAIMLFGAGYLILYSDTIYHLGSIWQGGFRVIGGFIALMGTWSLNNTFREMRRQVKKENRD